MIDICDTAEIANRHRQLFGIPHSRHITECIKIRIYIPYSDAKFLL